MPGPRKDKGSGRSSRPEWYPQAYWGKGVTEKHPSCHGLGTWPIPACACGGGRGRAPGELCRREEEKSKGRAGVLSFLLHTEQLSGAEEQKWDASSGLRGDTRQATAS